MNNNSDVFASYVRNWIHQNDLASTFMKQSLKARQIRDEYEKKVIDHLTQTHMENAIIQISDGRLSVVEERVPRSLTMKNIETLLHGYFAKKGGRDETTDVMNYLRGHRGVDRVKRLKRVTTTGQQPQKQPQQQLQQQPLQQLPQQQQQQSPY